MRDSFYIVILVGIIFVTLMKMLFLCFIQLVIKLS